MTVAFVFPGQGSQSVGMLSAFLAASLSLSRSIVPPASVIRP